MTRQEYFMFHRPQGPVTIINAVIVARTCNQRSVAGSDRTLLAWLRLGVVLNGALVWRKTGRKGHCSWGQHDGQARAQKRHPDVLCALTAGFSFVEVRAPFPTPADKRLPALAVTTRAKWESPRNHTGYHPKSASEPRSLLWAGLPWQLGDGGTSCRAAVKPAPASVLREAANRPAAPYSPGKQATAYILI